MIYYFNTNLTHHQVHKCRIKNQVVEWLFTFESQSFCQIGFNIFVIFSSTLLGRYLFLKLKGLIVKTVKMAWYLNVKTIISVCQMIIHTFCCYRFSIKWNGKVRNYFFEISKVLNLLGDDFVSDLFHM